jgi:hypothetical protein
MQGTRPIHPQIVIQCNSRLRLDNTLCSFFIEITLVGLIINRDMGKTKTIALLLRRLIILD